MTNVSSSVLNGPSPFTKALQVDQPSEILKGDLWLLAKMYLGANSNTDARVHCIDTRTTVTVNSCGHNTEPTKCIPKALHVSYLAQQLKKQSLIKTKIRNVESLRTVSLKSSLIQSGEYIHLTSVGSLILGLNKGINNSPENHNTIKLWHLYVLAPTNNYGICRQGWYDLLITNSKQKS